MLDFERLFAKYRLPSSERVATPPGCWTNFLGLHTRTDMFPAAENLSGKYVAELPLNGDGVYGPPAEYAALLTAIEAKQADRRSFSAIELGAGWGPWISAAGVVCKRLGFKTINLVGVEAEKAKVARMTEHLTMNGLMQAPVHCKILKGAAWHEDATVFFPKELSIVDYGGAATTREGGLDYRGIDLETEATSGYSLETICAGLDRVDFAHLDVAGAEWKIADMSREFMSAKFHHIFIGTHSRKIEGNLIQLFYELGWHLLKHDACHYNYDLSKPTVEAMTLSDGCMLFRNPRFMGTT
ncbi:MAG: hypothetical protein QOH65_377 [Methylobacteriaceae bacterium]|nr:hypothetical protein [Methylobacteriaceae bacterium]